MPKLIDRSTFLNPNHLVGSKIKKARQKAGLTQTQMANQANKVLSTMGAISLPLHTSELTRLEGGKRGLKFLEAWAIAQALNVKPEEFLPGSE